jgi:class 3 adenylate cyclase/Arc/MetJ family transcription regulator
VSVSARRKVVTVLFCDLVSSTALGESVDPELLQRLLARYFERMKGIVESQGGTVEKFIGDAVMAVFGVPVAHEDDALRACRAAEKMRDALPELGISGRIGVNTGEVVTGTEERLATGDAVNVAARLEQAADPGGVLVGEPTLQLVRDAVEWEAVEPLELKGKSEPMAAFRLLRVLEAPDRRHDTVFVGRDREQEVLHDSWRLAVDGQECVLVTVIGDAGVGKSRLFAEFLASLQTRVVRGRCLPYGDGVGYWPVVEVLKQLDLRPKEETAAAAIRSLLGESDAPTSADELAWAFRKTLERAAITRPLIVVLDDIQWGDERFLDLVEHVALFSSGAPLLLLAMARPELLERRPTWPVALRLEPLPEGAVQKLLPETLARDLRKRIIRAAGGNPLFVHEMVAMAGENADELTVPATLQALLAARLDQLEGPERAVLERGAVEGEIFHRGAVQALSGEEQVTPRLAALVRKQLIRPDRPQLAGDDGFRFRHLLIRDAAYDSLPKAVRADLHAAYARWLDEHGQSLVELDQILAYHFEQACRYREEVGLSPDAELVAAARQRLRATGVRAYAGADFPTAIAALSRALELARQDIDVIAGIHLTEALYWGGQHDEARRWSREFVARAEAARDRRALLCARLEETSIMGFSEPEGATERLDALVSEAEPEFAAVGDEYALYVAARMRGLIANMRGRMDAVTAAYDDAEKHGRRAGLTVDLSGAQATGRWAGTTPVRDLLSWIDTLDPAQMRGVYVRSRYVGALAMSARFDEARAVLASLLEELQDRGDQSEFRRVQADLEWLLARFTNDLVAAAAAGEAFCAILEKRGERSALSSHAPLLARVLSRLGRLDEAEHWAKKGRELGAEDDVETQMLWRQAEALVRAQRRQTDQAIVLAREAVAIALETDLLNGQGDAYFDLGEVLALADGPSEAAAAYEAARERYERKGNVLSAERTRERLTALHPA